MVFYTGDKFPGWKRNLLLGSMRMSRLAPHRPYRAHRVQRELGSHPQAKCCCSTCTSASRDVEQSPDLGYIYVITDEGGDSALMKLEPET